MVDEIKKGQILMLLSVLFGALMYLLSDLAFRTYPETTPQNAVFWGFLGSFIVASPYFLGIKSKREKTKTTIKRDGKVLLLTSFTTSLGVFLWFFVISNSSSGLVSLLSNSEVLFSLFLGCIFLHEKVSKKELGFMAVMVAGIIIISNLRGEITWELAGLIFMTRLLYALQSFFIKKLAPNIDGYSFGYLRTGIITILLGLIFYSLGYLEPLDWRPWGLFTVALMCNALLAKMFHFEAHKYLPISRLNFFLLLKPVLVLFGGYLLWQDPLSIQKIVGGVLILFGLWGLNKRKKN